MSSIEDALDMLEAKESQAALIARRDALLKAREELRAQNKLIARRDQILAARQKLRDDQQAAEEMLEALDAGTGFTPAQRKFVRNAEFLRYLKVLDELILEFDRSNQFNAPTAIDKTIQRLTELKAKSRLTRAGLAAAILLNPRLPRELYARLVAKSFLRYIRWQAALDLDR